MQRVLSCWKRCRNGPTRLYTYSSWNSVFTMGFSVSDRNLVSHKNILENTKLFENDR